MKQGCQCDLNSCNVSVVWHNLNLKLEFKKSLQIGTFKKIISVYKRSTHTHRHSFSQIITPISTLRSEDPVVHVVEILEPRESIPHSCGLGK